MTDPSTDNYCRLRCNRQSPCSACLQRGAECTYSSSEQERKDAIDYRPHRRSRNARQRVARIESLVTELAHSSQQPVAPPSEVLDDETETQGASFDGHTAANIGKLSLEEGNAVYTGSSHWATILDDVCAGAADLMSFVLMIGRFDSSKTNYLMTFRTAQRARNRLYTLLIRNCRPLEYHF